MGECDFGAGVVVRRGRGKQFPAVLAAPRQSQHHAHDEDLRLVMEMMTGCGLRNGEAHATNVNGLVSQDVYRINDQVHGRQRVPTPLKHRNWGEFRETPMPAKTRAYLMQYT
ncbi:hypothetical protein LRD69_01605 [Streptomyces sp. JH14]|uniref:hypothetical protein n=1 Tax=Streptomyces sp. JH14 TaxID=2793630 RepID=UPI0023F77502|nr:hypothetical protein [Streptomyces sp. JH14]MDF6040884.1 hypothetical protein [Streptomyces sp. JH14]